MSCADGGYEPLNVTSGGASSRVRLPVDSTTWGRKNMYTEKAIHNSIADAIVNSTFLNMVGPLPHLIISTEKASVPAIGRLSASSSNYTRSDELMRPCVRKAESSIRHPRSGRIDQLSFIFHVYSLHDHSRIRKLDRTGTVAAPEACVRTSCVCCGRGNTGIGTSDHASSPPRRAVAQGIDRQQRSSARAGSSGGGGTCATFASSVSRPTPHCGRAFLARSSKAIRLPVQELTMLAATIIVRHRIQHTHSARRPAHLIGSSPPESIHACCPRSPPCYPISPWVAAEASPFNTGSCDPVGQRLSFQDTYC